MDDMIKVGGATVPPCSVPPTHSVRPQHPAPPTLHSASEPVDPESGPVSYPTHHPCPLGCTLRPLTAWLYTLSLPPTLVSPSVSSLENTCGEASLPSPVLSWRLVSPGTVTPVSL